MDKEENRNNTPKDENQNLEKETEKPEENLADENKQETPQETKEEIKKLLKEHVKEVRTNIPWSGENDLITKKIMKLFRKTA